MSFSSLPSLVSANVVPLSESMLRVDLLILLWVKVSFFSIFLISNSALFCLNDLEVKSIGLPNPIKREVPRTEQREMNELVPFLFWNEEGPSKPSLGSDSIAFVVHCPMRSWPVGRVEWTASPSEWQKFSLHVCCITQAFLLLITNRLKQC